MKKDSNESSCCWAGASTTREIGIKVLLNFASCTFFSMIALRAFFFHHALIVRQIESGGLHAAVSFARAEDFVDDANRRRRAQLWIAILRIDRQIVFQFLQVLTELRQLRRLSIVAQSHVGFERCLVTEQFIFVCLVRPDGDVDRRIEIHPGDVTVVIVVGDKCIGALVEKVF